MKIYKLPLLLLFFLLIILLAAGGLGVALAFLNSSPGSAPEEGVLFQVTKGEASEHVFVRLEQEGLIRSSLWLRLVAKFAQTEAALKTGIYRIKPDQTTMDIHTLLVSGKQEMKRVTINEGWTLSRIAFFLEETGLLSAAQFLKRARSPELLSRYGIPGRSVEGFLFPETYYFPYAVSEDAVLVTMLDTFFAKLEEVYPGYKKLAPKALYQKVIVASIVEREYRREDEAPVMASVFYNRIKRNQPLESCATVEYVLTEIQGKPHHERLTLADTRVPSPYNTYVNYGLPPGPIGNPGATALIAAFFPMDTNYLYFLLKDAAAGEHVFSETFQKHLKAKELYIKSY